MDMYIIYVNGFILGLAGSFCVWLARSKSADAFKGRFLWSNWDVNELQERVAEIQDGDLLITGLHGV